jgi:indolepyruvate ferredoxin oxidoreductase
MIMVGFAWQKGLIPISSRAIYRAIRLNGVQSDANLQAFELGRRVAHDPSARGEAEADVPTPETLDLDDLIARRTAELTAYQNAAYAHRYGQQVAAVAALGSDPLTRAVAVNLYKLMAYKDEYEVARLYSDGRFDQMRSETLKGGKAQVWLAPPLLNLKDSEGRPRKIAFGGWMLRYGFPVLARLKGLRGSALDLFGNSEERRTERRLISDYEAGLARLVAEYSPARATLALEIARLPDQIRGYGHVKDKAVMAADQQAASLWSAWAAI